MRKSEKIIQHIARAFRHVERAKNTLACYKVEEVLGDRYEDADRDKMREADAKLDEARRMVSEVFEGIIGREIMKEVRCGKWGKR